MDPEQITDQEIDGLSLSGFRLLYKSIQHPDVAPKVRGVLDHILDMFYQFAQQARIDRLEITKSEALARYYELHSKKHVCFQEMIPDEANIAGHVVELIGMYEQWDEDLRNKVESYKAEGWKVEKEYEDQTCGKCYILVKGDKP